VDRAAALEVLGLAPGVRHDDIKRRFRQLAHDLHPDRGGDPERFQSVHEATRTLLEAPQRAAAPRVARGRPSRDAIDTAGRAAGVRSPQRPDLPDQDLVPLCDDEWRAIEPRPRVGVLDVLLLARILLDATSLELISRAPGARTNRFAPLLAGDSASTLHFRRLHVRRATPPGDLPSATSVARPSHRTGTHVALLARGRAARRALAAAPTEGLRTASWRRERGDTSILLAGTVRSDVDPLHTARLAATAASELLEVLGWPIEQWALSAPPSRPSAEPPTF
jgi:curved DNA-binding protein CbpA